MKYVALALVLLTLPAFISLLRQNPHQRHWAFIGIGLLMFCGGEIRIDASIIGWPLWSGIAKGIEISPLDTLALAAIVTRPRRPGALPFWGLFGFYGAAIALSCLMSTVWMASVFVGWYYARVLLVFAAISAELERPAMKSGLFVGLSLGLMLQAGYVIWQKLHGVVQATGTMYHQNTLGMMVELALLPLLAALLGGERRMVVKIGVVAGLIVIVGGGSRAALVFVGSGVVAVALLSLIRQVTPTKLRIVGLGVLILAVVTPLALLTLKERFGSNSVITEETERAAFERSARAMAGDHPFGVGANMYVATANLKGYADRAGVAWNFANRSAPVHNAYLLARAETGWAGQFAYMLMLIIPVVRGLMVAFKRRKEPTGDVVVGACCALSVLIFHNTYEFAGLTYPVLTVAMVNLALIASAVRQLAPRRKSLQRRPMPYLERSAPGSLAAPVR